MNGLITILILISSTIIRAECISSLDCESCLEQGCTWQPGPNLCSEDCMVADSSCYTESCPSNSYQGIVRAIEVSFCMDACGMFYLESDSQAFNIINITYLSDLEYLNQFVGKHVEVTGEMISCVECDALNVTEIQILDDCPEGYVECLVDPCLVNSCPSYPNAECEANYCGGCYADYYINGELVDCESNECVDLTNISFGPCTMFLGIGFANDSCQGISGCSYYENGIDYSNAFFDSFEACENMCIDHSYTCDEIELLYSDYHSGEVLDCEVDSDCNIVEGDCGVGIGGCYYSVNNQYQEEAVNNLVEDWIQMDCMEWVCSCLPPPYPICLDNQCASQQCLGANPAGCNSTGCSEEFECLDYEITGDCVPSACFCDEIYGEWYCTEDCNGGSCYLPGDLNVDNQLNVMDVIQVISLILNPEDFNNFNTWASDINTDNAVNVLDVIVIVDFILNEN